MANDSFSSTSSSSSSQVDEAQLVEENSHPRAEFAVVNTHCAWRRIAAAYLEECILRFGDANVLELRGDDEDHPRLLAFLAPYRVHRSRLVVVGGDGTVGWVVAALEDKVHDWDSKADRPFLCVVPTGLRNDFSRALGWGNAASKDILKRRMTDCLDTLGDKGRIVMMDRWAVSVTYYLDHSKFILNRTMVTSFSVGCDAELWATLQRLTEDHPRLVGGQIQRRFWYGAITLAHSPSDPLNLFLKVSIDGKDVPIPKGTRSLAVANVNSFAAGIRVWRLSKKEALFKGSEIDDGKLEVVAFTGVVHLALGAINLKRAEVVGQGSVIDIQCGIEPDAVQVDGEILDFTSPIQVLIRPAGQFKALVHNTAYCGERRTRPPNP